MAFETPRTVNDYPPAAFCSKYEKFLAPHGLLLPPKQVLRNKKLGEGAEKNLRKAFKITVTKLKKMRDSCAACGRKPENAIECGDCRVVRYCSDLCRQRRVTSHDLVCHLLRQEAVDQLVECLPCPVVVGKESLQGRGGPVLSWNDWLDRHSSFGSNVRSAASIVSLWWEYTGTKHPGDAAVRAALERLVTNVFSTVLTIAHSLLWLRQPVLFSAPPTSSSADSVPSSPINNLPLDQMLLLQCSQNGSSGKDIHIHLLGADKPEVSMVESGLVQVCSRVLTGYRVHLTLVAPDLSKHPHTLALSPSAPMQVTADLTVGCYPGLYHNFWEDHVSTNDPKRKVPRPDVAVAIHPGCHTREMWALWKPTFVLLAEKKVPLFLTTYNLAEYEETLKVLQEIQPTVCLSGPNPLRSLQTKQTPYEPDHVWASNAYGIGIANN